MVPKFIVDRLVEDAEDLQSQNIRWMILDPQSPSYIINHLPHRSPGSAPSYKAQADEVLDSILCSPQVARLFDDCAALNRWDVLAKVAEGVDLEVLATTLQNLDHLILVEAGTGKHIRPALEPSVVQPPNLILASPPTILSSYAIGLVCHAASILHHQSMSTPGRSLLTFEHAEVAACLAGAKIACGAAGFLTLTTGNAAHDGELCKARGIDPGAPWDSRLKVLPTPPRLALSVENVAAAAHLAECRGDPPTDMQEN
jgi:hypothetical protein